jgi:DNA-binding winged helix-turn-helix (wHTH) protein
VNPALEFPPFRLDPSDQRLWRKDQPLKLRPKTYDVLAQLVARAPSLVTQEELLAAVWGDASVGP